MGYRHKRDNVFRQVGKLCARDLYEIADLCMRHGMQEAIVEEIVGGSTMIGTLKIIIQDIYRKTEVKITLKP
jgi:hypothetical protein